MANQCTSCGGHFPAYPGRTKATSFILSLRGGGPPNMGLQWSQIRELPRLPAGFQWNDFAENLLYLRTNHEDEGPQVLN